MYHFRTNTGATCCQSESLEALCSRCRTRAAGAPQPVAATAQRAAVIRSVPKPPSLEAAMRENAARYQATTPPALARSLSETVREKALAAMNAARRPISPMPNSLARPRAASLNGAPPKPASLIDLIQKRNRT